MSAEFVDTNIFIYAHDRSSGAKFEAANDLLVRIWNGNSGVISSQVLTEFFSVATRKLQMSNSTAGAILEELGTWTVYSLVHPDLMEAVRLQRRHQLAWWDALILQSALATKCNTLWSEDFTDGQRFGVLTVRNPFIAAGPVRRGRRP